MTQQKMRLMAFEDRPKNVSRAEYAFYTLQVFLSITCVAGAAGMALAAFSGSSARTADDLEALPAMTVAEAAAATIDAGLVRIEGRLSAENVRAMPDDPELEVVLGSVELTATCIERHQSRTASLYGWSHEPSGLRLESDGASIPIAFDPGFLPAQEDAPREPTPERITDGAGPRLAKTLGFTYLGEARMLPDAWGPVSSALAKVQRRYVPAGLSVVVAARLEVSSEGARLVAGAERAPKVLEGTLADVRERGAQLGKRLRVWWLPVLAGGVLLFLRTRRIRRGFVERSNA